MKTVFVNGNNFKLILKESKKGKNFAIAGHGDRDKR